MGPRDDKAARRLISLLGYPKHLTNSLEGTKTTVFRSECPTIGGGRVPHQGDVKAEFRGTDEPSTRCTSWQASQRRSPNSFAFNISCCYPRVEPAEPQSRARCVRGVLTSGINSKEPAAGIGKPVGILIDR